MDPKHEQTEEEYVTQAENDLKELGKWPDAPDLRERLQAWHRQQYREWVARLPPAPPGQLWECSVCGGVFQKQPEASIRLGVKGPKACSVTCAKVLYDPAYVDKVAIPLEKPELPAFCTDDNGLR